MPIIIPSKGGWYSPGIWIKQHQPLNPTHSNLQILHYSSEYSNNFILLILTNITITGSLLMLVLLLLLLLFLPFFVIVTIVTVINIRFFLFFLLFILLFLMLFYLNPDLVLEQ